MKTKVQTLYKRGYLLFLYLLLFVFFAGKVNFYQSYVGRFPDEPAHLGYIAYLCMEGKLIPDFNEIYTSVSVPAEKTGELTDEITIVDSHSNYLGHPPLYYQLMRFSRGIRMVEGQLFVNLEQLRDFSQLFCYAAVLLSFYIGFSRLGNTIWHLLYGMMIVCVPMAAYNNGLTNDSLVFLGVTIVMLALIRLSEGKRNAMSYWLVAIGVFVSVLTKLTGGLIVVIGCGLFVISTIVREKSHKILFNKLFARTLPIYLLILIYFIIIIHRYRTVQPSLKVINPEAFYLSGFYIPEENRAHLDFGAYTRRYWSNFFFSWTGIVSHVSLLKDGPWYSLNQIALVAVLVLPLFSFYSRKTEYAGKRPCKYLYFGVLLGILYQFYSSYEGFRESGYLGVQSRYYLCALPSMAFLITTAAEERVDFISQMSSDIHKKIILIISAVLVFLFCALLVYEDFGYFLVHFNNYLVPLM